MFLLDHGVKIVNKLLIFSRVESIIGIIVEICVRYKFKRS